MHAEGFRAQWAEPTVLFRLPGEDGDLVAEVAATYGAEVWEVESLAAARGRCIEEEIGLPEKTVEMLLEHEIPF